MSELIKYIVEYLVEYPEQINIHEVDVDGIIHIKLKVADSDTGRVIGKQGKIAKALRDVLKSASSKNNQRYILDIL